MTGFGTGDAPLVAGRLVLELRSVNHRYLEVRTRLPSAIADTAPLVEDIVRGRLDRGRVEVTGRLEGNASAEVRLDEPRAEAALLAIKALRDRVAPGEPLPFGLLATLPDLFVPAEDQRGEPAREAVQLATTRALDALEAMRAREGQALAADLEAKLGRIEGGAHAAAARVPGVVVAQRDKLRDRVARLLEGTGASLDEGRLEQEIALLADRADVAEELTRLDSHIGQFRALMSSAARSVGRELDFLLQEMHREVNTLGSKSADAEISQIVVGMKSELARLREQVANVA